MVLEKTDIFLKDYFEPRWFREVEKTYEWFPKVVVCWLPDYVKGDIRNWNVMSPTQSPDFVIVKSPEVETHNAFQKSIIPIRDDIKFSLRSIIDTDTSPVFTCIRKWESVIRLPHMKKETYWDIPGKLLIRE